mgnify:FL=1
MDEGCECENKGGRFSPTRGHSGSTATRDTLQMAPAISTVAVNPGIYAAATGGERRAGRFSKVRAVRNAADPSTTKRKKDYKTTKTAAARLTHCAPPSLTQASQRSSAPKVAPGGEFYPLFTPASRLPRRSRPNKASGSRPEPLDNLPGKIG